jgi:hypothetical protein
MPYGYIMEYVAGEASDYFLWTGKRQWHHYRCYQLLRRMRDGELAGYGLLPYTVCGVRWLDFPYVVKYAR